MRESGGRGQHVSDEALVAGIRLLAETTGVFTETAGGVTVAGALALAEAGHFHSDDEIVLCITGNGLKTTEAISDVLPAAPVIAPKVRDVAALVAERTGSSRLHDVPIAHIRDLDDRHSVVTHGQHVLSQPVLWSLPRERSRWLRCAHDTRVHVVDDRRLTTPHAHRGPALRDESGPALLFCSSSTQHHSRNQSMSASRFTTLTFSRSARSRSVACPHAVPGAQTTTQR